MNALQDEINSEIEWALHNHNPADYIVYGADEEKAILKAIRKRVPNAIIRVCVDHIFSSLMRNATTNGITKEERYDAWEYVTALSREKNEATFTRAKDILQDYWITNKGADDVNNGKESRRRFGKKLIETLDLANKYHRQPFLKSEASKERGEHSSIDDIDYNLDLHYTNNNAESVNNMIQNHLNYTQTSAPVLLQTLMGIMSNNNSNMYKAMCGSGDYKLREEQEKMIVKKHIWDTKSQNEKKEHLKKVLQGAAHKTQMKANVRTPQVVDAPEGDFAVLRTPGGRGKKPIEKTGKTNPRPDAKGRRRLTYTSK